MQIKFILITKLFLIAFSLTGCYKESQAPSCTTIYQEAYREGLVEGRKNDPNFSSLEIWKSGGFSSITDYAEMRGRLRLQLNATGKYGKVCE
jgi:hypothetical protein